MNTALATRSVNETPLVKPASPEEDVLSLISEMRRNNLTAEQINYTSKQRRTVFTMFRKIVRKQFGLSDEQILDLNDQRIETLFVMLVSRAQKNLWYQYPLHFFPLTLLIILSIYDGWTPGFKLSLAINNLRRAEDRSITGSDLRQHIESYYLLEDDRVMERSASDKQRLAGRRKP